MFYFVFFLGFLSQSAYAEEEPNSFLVWAKQYAQDTRQEGGWVCGLRPASSISGFPWWVSPLQGSDWSRLQWSIPEQLAKSMLLRRTMQSDTSRWPTHLKSDHVGYSINISKYENDAVVQKYFELFRSKNRSLPVTRDKIHRFKDGHFQVWDEHLWLTATMGRLSQVAPICWEQHVPTRSAWPNTSKFLGWIPSEQCQHMIIFQAENWSSRPDVRWAAPNGTQWLCGSNLWPWLPPGWVGRCTLGFPWIQGRWVESVDQTGNLSLLQHKRSGDVFYPHKGPSSPSVHSVGLRDAMLLVESLARYLDKALNDTTNEISLSNFEAQLVRKAELQQQMARDSMTAATGGSCEVLPGECCVYIPKRTSIEHVKSNATSFSDRMWDFLYKIPVWMWIIPVICFVFIVLLLRPCIVQYVLKFICSGLESICVFMILPCADTIMNIGNPTTAPEADEQQEHGLDSLVVVCTQPEPARMTLCSSAL